MNDTERAYLAGIIDGEGSIMLIHHHPKPSNGTRYEYWVVRVSVANTDQRLIDWLLARFPMSGYSIGRNNRETQRDTLQWRVDNRKVVPVLDAAFPFLVLKRRQAEIAYEYMTTHRYVGRKGHTPETVKHRRRLATEMRALNHRGP